MKDKNKRWRNKKLERAFRNKKFEKAMKNKKAWAKAGAIGLSLTPIALSAIPTVGPYLSSTIAPFTRPAVKALWAGGSKRAFRRAYNQEVLNMFNPEKQFGLK